MPYILRIAGQFSLGDMHNVINNFDIAQVILIENLVILCSVPDQRMCTISLKRCGQLTGYLYKWLHCTSTA